MRRSTAQTRVLAFCWCLVVVGAAGVLLWQGVRSGLGLHWLFPAACLAVLILIATLVRWLLRPVEVRGLRRTALLATLLAILADWTNLQGVLPEIVRWGVALGTPAAACLALARMVDAVAPASSSCERRLRRGVGLLLLVL